MPRLVAFKHPVWTGRIVRVQHDLGASDVRIDGVWFGYLLVGREVGTRRRYTFHGGDAERGVYGLPPWCYVLREWTGEDADAWRATLVMSR